MKTIKAFKGFNQDMTCTPTEDIKFQYEEGKEYEESGAIACEKGFHACEYPLDALGFYYPNESVYHEVELSGDIDRSEDDKTCASKIKIGAEISIAGLVKAAIEYTRERTREGKNSYNDYGASSATGYKGASSATGDYGASSATGYKGASSQGTRERPVPQGTMERPAPQGTRERPAPQGTRERPVPQGTRERPVPQGTTERPVPQGTAERPVPQGTRENPLLAILNLWQLPGDISLWQKVY